MVNLLQGPVRMGIHVECDYTGVFCTPSHPRPRVSERQSAAVVDLHFPPVRRDTFSCDQQFGSCRLAVADSVRLRSQRVRGRQRSESAEPTLESVCDSESGPQSAADTPEGDAHVCRV